MSPRVNVAVGMLLLLVIMMFWGRGVWHAAWGALWQK